MNSITSMIENQESINKISTLQIKLLEVIENEEDVSVQEAELALILCLKEIKEDQL